MRYRAERALSARTDQPAWVVIDDYVMHREANAYLAALRARDRSTNTERVYAGRIALYLTYCSETGLDWKTRASRHYRGSCGTWSRSHYRRAADRRQRRDTAPRALPTR